MPTRSIVTFTENPGIEIIVGRITGNNISNIDGTISTNQASVFLLNPNGFIFGPNAALNVGGSFITSTAETIQFQDGTEFRVADATPLLSVSTPIGLQLGSQSGAINIGTTAIPGPGNQLYQNPNFSINRSNRPDGLAVNNGATLALLANGVAMVGGNLTAPEGRLELGSVNGPGLVTLQQVGTEWRLGYDNINNFSDITLTQAASADVSGNSSGHLQVVGRHINLSEGSALIAETLGDGTAGLLNVQAESLSLSGISPITPAAAPAVPGLPPNVPFATGIFANVGTAQSGAGSNIIINTQDLVITDGAQITAATFGSGHSGDLSVDAQTIDLTGGTPFGPSGLLTGVAGRAPIYGTAAEELVNAALAQPIPSGPPPAPLLFALPPRVTGNSGDLTINTQDLRVQDGAQIYSISFGLGDAGQLTIGADTIDISGSNPGGPSALFASAETPIPGAGNASDITINTRLLNVSDGGQISTGTQGPGNAGNVLINATESVRLLGADESGRSGIFSSAIGLTGFPAGTGQGGNVTVNTPQLEILQGATISASNFPSTDNPELTPGEGEAGSINVNVLGDNGTLLLNQGEITAASRLENGGNINLQVQDVLLLRNQSQITARAGEGGSGGNISIATPFLVAVPSEDSNIIASALNGPGGNILITASSIFNLQERPAISDNGTNDIDASSQFGLDGTVTIQNPELDPDQGLVSLPVNPIERSDLFSQSCGSSQNVAANQFTLTGRGGLPSNPGQNLEDTAALVDLSSGSGTSTSTANHRRWSQPSLPSSPMVEAQSWTTDEQGQIILTTQPAQSVPPMAGLTYASCQAS